MIMISVRSSLPPLKFSLKAHSPARLSARARTRRPMKAPLSLTFRPHCSVAKGRFTNRRRCEVPPFPPSLPPTLPSFSSLPTPASRRPSAVRAPGSICCTRERIQGRFVKLRCKKVRPPIGLPAPEASSRGKRGSYRGERGARGCWWRGDSFLPPSLPFFLVLKMDPPSLSPCPGWIRSTMAFGQPPNRCHIFLYRPPLPITSPVLASSTCHYSLLGLLYYAILLILFNSV